MSSQAGENAPGTPVPGPSNAHEQQHEKNDAREKAPEQIPETTDTWPLFYPRGPPMDPVRIAEITRRREAAWKQDKSTLGPTDKTTDIFSLKRQVDAIYALRGPDNQVTPEEREAMARKLSELSQGQWYNDVLQQARENNQDHVGSEHFRRLISEMDKATMDTVRTTLKMIPRTHYQPEEKPATTHQGGGDSDTKAGEGDASFVADNSLSTRIHQLETELADRDQTVNGLEKKVEEKAEDEKKCCEKIYALQEQNKKLEEQSATTARLFTERVKRDEMKRSDEKIAFENEINSLKNNLAHESKQNENLIGKESKQSKKRTIVELRDEIKILEEEKKEKEKENEDLEVKNTEMQSELGRRDYLIAKQDVELVTKDGQLAERQADIAARDKQMETMALAHGSATQELKAKLEEKEKELRKANESNIFHQSSEKPDKFQFNGRVGEQINQDPREDLTKDEEIAKLRKQLEDCKYHRQVAEEKDQVAGRKDSEVQESGQKVEAESPAIKVSDATTQTVTPTTSTATGGPAGQSGSAAQVLKRTHPKPSVFNNNKDEIIRKLQAKARDLEEHSTTCLNEKQGLEEETRQLKVENTKLKADLEAALNQEATQPAPTGTPPNGELIGEVQRLGAETEELKAKNKAHEDYQANAKVWFAEDDEYMKKQEDEIEKLQQKYETEVHELRQENGKLHAELMKAQNHQTAIPPSPGLIPLVEEGKEVEVPTAEPRKSDDGTKELKALISSLEQGKQQADDELQKVQAQLQQCRDHGEELRAQASFMEREKQQAIEELQRVQARIPPPSIGSSDDKDCSAEDLKPEPPQPEQLTALQARVNKLQSELEKRQNHGKVLQQKISNLEKEKDALETRLQATVAANTPLPDETPTYDEDKDTKISKLQDRGRGLEDERDILDNRVAELEAENTKIKENLAKRRKQFTDTMTSLTKTQKQLVYVQTQRTGAEESLTNTRDELKKTVKKLGDTENELANARGRIKTDEALRKSFIAVEVDELSGKLKDAALENDKLRKDLQECLQRNKTAERSEEEDAKKTGHQDGVPSGNIDTKSLQDRVEELESQIERAENDHENSYNKVETSFLWYKDRCEALELVLGKGKNDVEDPNQETELHQANDDDLFRKLDSSEQHHEEPRGPEAKDRDDPEDPEDSYEVRLENRLSLLEHQLMVLIDNIMRILEGKKPDLSAVDGGLPILQYLQTVLDELRLRLQNCEGHQDDFPGRDGSDLDQRDLSKKDSDFETLRNRIQELNKALRDWLKRRKMERVKKHKSFNKAGRGGGFSYKNPDSPGISDDGNGDDKFPDRRPDLMDPLDSQNSPRRGPSGFSDSPDSQRVPSLTLPTSESAFEQTPEDTHDFPANPAEAREKMQRLLADNERYLSETNRQRHLIDSLSTQLEAQREVAEKNTVKCQEEKAALTSDHEEEVARERQARQAAEQKVQERARNPRPVDTRQTGSAPAADRDNTGKVTVSPLRRKPRDRDAPPDHDGSENITLPAARRRNNRHRGGWWMPFFAVVASVWLVYTVLEGYSVCLHLSTGHGYYFSGGFDGMRQVTSFPTWPHFILFLILGLFVASVVVVYGIGLEGVLVDALEDAIAAILASERGQL